MFVRIALIVSPFIFIAVARRSNEGKLDTPTKKVIRQLMSSDNTNLPADIRELLVGNLQYLVGETLRLAKKTNSNGDLDQLCESILKAARLKPKWGWSSWNCKMFRNSNRQLERNGRYYLHLEIPHYFAGVDDGPFFIYLNCTGYFCFQTY